MSIYAISQRTSVRVAVLLLVLTQCAVMFDQWWHDVFGRDSFAIPPHYFVYGMSACLILFSWFAWRQFRTVQWRRLGILMTLLPISAPFDSFWHATFGIEDAKSVLVAWSPPHVVLALMFMATQYVILGLVRKYETDEEAKKLLTLLILALFVSSSSFLLMPLQPFNYFHIFGLYGFIITLPILVSLLILSRREFGFAGATLLSVFFLARVFAGSQETIPAYAPINALLLHAAPLLFASLFLDAMPRKTAILTQAAVFAGAFAFARVIVFFMFSVGLYERYQMTLRLDYVVFAATTIIGCLLGGLLYYLFEKRFVSHVVQPEKVVV